MAKRFYKTVSTQAADDGGFHILLDGRQLKTPGKISLRVPSQPIADLIAAEWDSQENEIDPTAMPVTRLLNVAVEQTPTNREALVAEARNYAASDLLCYRANEPSDLVARQAKMWQPWLDWAAGRDISLAVTQGVMAVNQDEGSLDTLARYAEGLDDVALTLFVHFTAVFGSAILAVAVMDGALGAKEAYDLSRLDEAFQNELWGEDDDAAGRNAAILADTLALAAVLERD